MGNAPPVVLEGSLGVEAQEEVAPFAVDEQDGLTRRQDHQTKKETEAMTHDNTIEITTTQMII